MLQIVATTDEPSVPTPPVPDTEVTFDDFYALYPRHEARKDAVRAWAKIPKSEYVAILTALYDWRRVWSDRGDDRYTPLPASWLNGERWTDDLPNGYRPTPIRRSNGPVVTAAPQEQGERQPIPDHVKAMLAKLKEGKK